MAPRTTCTACTWIGSRAPRASSGGGPHKRAHEKGRTWSTAHTPHPARRGDHRRTAQNTGGRPYCVYRRWTARPLVGYAPVYHHHEHYRLYILSLSRGAARTGLVSAWPGDVVEAVGGLLPLRGRRWPPCCVRRALCKHSGKPMGGLSTYTFACILRVGNYPTRRIVMVR